MPRVLTLSVPEVGKEEADGSFLHEFLLERLRDGVTQNDTKREVGLAELASGEDAASKEAQALKNDGLLVGLSVFLILSDWVGDGGQGVAVRVPVEFDQTGSEALIREAFGIEVSCLLVEGLQVGT